VERNRHFSANAYRVNGTPKKNSLALRVAPELPVLGGIIRRLYIWVNFVGIGLQEIESQAPAEYIFYPYYPHFFYCPSLDISSSY